jgi:ubiquinone/menaquinone biosynthesis C-methylase UbiE
LATILRQWSYQYPWLYNAIAHLSSLPVGGEKRFHTLPLQGLTITPETKVLDLCCGGGQATKYLVQASNNVTGLDASPVTLERAEKIAPDAHYTEGLAQDLPFDNSSFDLVHTSVAMHEMTPEELQQIFREVYRVLKSGGTFAIIDLHQPTNPIFVPGLTLFMWLFETETAWKLLETDLIAKLENIGFSVQAQRLYAGGSLQVIQAQKP